jgi:hypothetical protein
MLCGLALPAAGGDRFTNIDGVLVPPQRLIAFLFLGHSNMEGYGGTPDTMTHPRAVTYLPTEGFVPARDPVSSRRNSPSPVMPFLKEMARLYPDYYFCGIKIVQAGLPMCKTFSKGMSHFQKVVSLMDSIGHRVTLGGMLTMFGFVEGISDSLSAAFYADATAMIQAYRDTLGIDSLPVFWGQYEQNADTTAYVNYHQYRARIIEAIDSLPRGDILGRTLLTPEQPVPREYYFDDHHYNEDGYRLWGQSTAQQLHDRGWHAWYSKLLDTIPPAPPSLTLLEPLPNGLKVAWSPAAAGEEVTRYALWRSGQLVTIVQGSVRAFTLENLPPSTVCTLTVTALDSAGNQSMHSEELIARTEEGSGGNCLRFLWPQKGTISSPIETLTARWESICPTIHEPVLELSTDAGDSWTRIAEVDASRGEQQLSLGSGLGDTGALCLLRLVDDETVLASSDRFYLLPSTPSCNTRLQVLDKADTAVTVIIHTPSSSLAALFVNGVQRMQLIASPLPTSRTITGLQPATPVTLTVHEMQPDRAFTLACDSICTTTLGGGIAGKDLFLEHPRGGERFSAGESLTVVWSYDRSQVSAVDISFSGDSGRTWQSMDQIPSVPAEQCSVSFAVNEMVEAIGDGGIRIRIMDYGGRFSDKSELLYFEATNVEKSLSRTSHDDPIRIVQAGKDLAVRFPPDQKASTVLFYRLDGRVIARIAVPKAPGMMPLPHDIGSGVLLLRIHEDKGSAVSLKLHLP